MRELYIIITGRLDHIGGSELYTLRRIKYLQNRGFGTLVITSSFKKEEVLLKELENFNIIELKNIQYNEKKYINRLENNLKDQYKKIYIETHCFWEFGEKLAQRLKTINFIYLMAEQPFFNFPNKRFFLEKLKNDEIIGVSEETLRISFGEEWKKGNYKNNYVNISFDKEEIQSDKNREKIYKLEKNEENIRILTVSRFEKTYIEELIKDVLKISKKYKNKSFELILIGDSSNREIRINLIEKYKNTSNLKIRFLGYITPLFSELYENLDLFVGMGTALINAVSFECISLGIDARNNRTSGFFGRDIKTFGYHSSDKTVSIFEKIEEFILMKKEEKDQIKKKSKKLYEENFGFLNTMQKLDSYILNEEKYKKITYTMPKREYKYYIKIILFKLKVLNILLKIKNKIKPNKKFVNL